MKNIIRKKNSGVISLLVILCFLIIPTLTFAQKLTHIVEEGDTLWDICEQYYGDSSLWPKLWEMNPFITNPHLLKKGDVITLFEKEPVKAEVKKVETPPPPEEKAPVVVEVKKAPSLMGIDLTAFTPVDAIGTFSREEVRSWGRVFASETGNVLLAKGDTAYVIFDEAGSAGAGDRFFVGSWSKKIEHPVTGKKIGRVFRVNGIVTIKGQAGGTKKDDTYYEKKNVFEATVDESFNEVNIDDVLIPYESIASCILPVSAAEKMVGNIVSVKDQLNYVSIGSIVYIDLGSNDGLKKGNVLSIMEPNVVPDPDKEENFFTWRSKLILPDIFIGRVMVIECGTDMSTAIVLSASKPFPVGLYVKELSWDETPDFLSAMAACPIQ